MKKTLFPIVLLSALFAVVSCSKSFDPSEDGLVEATDAKVFTASIENSDTKTDLADKKVNWVSGDKISINGALYTATPKTDATQADFSGSGATKVEGKYKAYYPSVLYNEGTPTLPSSYTYNAAHPFEVYPMYAQSENTSLKFSNICGALAITVKSSVLSNVKSITVSSSNCAMSGAFSVEETTTGSGKYYASLTSPTTVANTVTLNCGESGVETTPGGTIFYIPIPAQTYKDIRIIVNNASYMVTTKSSIEIERNKIYSFEYSGTNIEPVEPLSGEFSVSATKKVKFSKGNLQASIDASGNPTGWKFATNQYDIVGNAVANTSIGITKGYIDLFGWSTDGTGATSGYKPWGINASFKVETDYRGNFVDWGTNPSLISALGSGWRTLSYDEWKYLLGKVTSSRTNASSLYKYGVKVCGISNCLIIAPDGYDYTKFQTEYSETSTPLTWGQAELEGLVCLPPAGERYGSSVVDAGSGGYYWSSTPDGEVKAYPLYFDGEDADFYDDCCRLNGHSVRLVR